MRVIVNEASALGRKAGIGHYTDQLLRCLCAQQGEDRIETFPNGWVRRACELYARTRSSLDTGRDDGQKGFGAPARWSARLRQGVLQCLRQAGLTVVGRHFRALCARERYDLYHEPNFIPLPCDRPTLVTLHDLSMLLHPQWHPADRVRNFERHLPRVLKDSGHFVTVSHFIRKEVIQVLGIAPERVTAVHNGIRPELWRRSGADGAATRAHLGLPPRYLLSVGTIEPRKNILMLLETYCSLPESLRSRWPLLLVGSWGWNAREVADYLERVARHRGVLHLGYLADEHLAAVYHGARALIYPSHYEGFGLPPIEMLACGGAVLASTAGALVETVGGQAHLIHAEDVDGWREALVRIATDDDWWHALRRGAEVAARPYTWDRAAAETLCLYRTLCGQQQPRRCAA